MIELKARTTEKFSPTFQFQPGTLALFCPMPELRAATIKKFSWMIELGARMTEKFSSTFQFQPGTLALFCPMLELRAATTEKFS